MTEQARLRRKERDHERYVASREQRKEHQRLYYRENREAILMKKRQNGFLTYGEAR